MHDFERIFSYRHAVNLLQTLTCVVRFCFEENHITLNMIPVSHGIQRSHSIALGILAYFFFKTKLRNMFEITTKKIGVDKNQKLFMPLKSLPCVKTVDNSWHHTKYRFLRQKKKYTIFEPHVCVTVTILKEISSLNRPNLSHHKNASLTTT